MGSMEAVIGLDLKMCATRAVRGIIGADADAGAGNGRLQRLKESVRSLEEERQKIEVFRRELPLCMRILTDVIEGLKREMEQCREEGRNEKFVPAKREFEEEGEAKAEKINWMSSVQLWNNNSSETKEGQENNKEKILEERLPEKGSLFLESKSRGGTGAFVPFKGLKAHGTNVVLTQKEKLTAVPGLQFLSPSIKSAPRPSSTAFQDHQAFPRVVNRTPAPATSSAHLGLQAQHPPSRKARRCWSPELHRRFVLALKQLGGAQAATPKQIRELMKVDGLTNDEVKSHLQKYRLHSQRKPSASATTKLPIIAEAGSWATASENYSSSSGQSLSKSGSPQSPLQLAGCNTTLSSSARDSCEDDGKSESSS